jgi:hypothetical protein
MFINNPVLSNVLLNVNAQLAYFGSLANTKRCPGTVVLVKKRLRYPLWLLGKYSDLS